MKEICEKIFFEQFGYKNQITSFAPGRVNLIGEHTDYNSGFVLPMAITKGIYAAAKKRDDKKIRLYSEDFKEDLVIESDLENIEKTGKWADYPLAVVKTFSSFGFKIDCGFDIAYIGNLPGGAGLSSSAALETVTIEILKNLFSLYITKETAAVMGQFAENRFVGVNCGIMDQFASSVCIKNHAVMLNCTTLAHKNVNIPDTVDVLIINSMVKRKLKGSAFNDRRKECEAALNFFKEKEGVSFLCDVSIATFNKYKDSMPCNVMKRAKHVISENNRVIESAKALSCGDVAYFGELMNESHISLRDDYEVSVEQLDFITEKAREIKEVYGSRMTGAGFGGCTVTLTKKGEAERIAEYIKDIYYKRFGIKAESYIESAGDGAFTF